MNTEKARLMRIQHQQRRMFHGDHDQSTHNPHDGGGDDGESEDDKAGNVEEIKREADLYASEYIKTAPNHLRGSQQAKALVARGYIRGAHYKGPKDRVDAANDFAKAIAPSHLGEAVRGAIAKGFLAGSISAREDSAP